MSDISEKAIKLINDLRRDISIDIMFTPEKNAEDDSLKALVDYIAELEGENAGLKERVAMLDVTAVYKSLGEMGYIEQVDKLNARIAELEGKIDQLTAHSDIERQDDKSSNDTQKETFVYGKDSKPLPCPLCGNIVDGKESR